MKALFGTHNLFAIAVTMCVATTVSAALIAEDTMDYSTGPLAGQGSATDLSRLR